MMKHTNKNIFIKCGLLVVSSILMSGCFELNFPDKQAYYSAMNNVLSVIKTDEQGLASSYETVSLEEYIFNDATVNDLNHATVLPSDYFEYLAVQVADDLEIQDCVIYVKSEENMDFKINVYIKDSLPDISKIRSFNLPEFNPETHEKINYSDDYVDPLFSSTFSVAQNEWASMYVQSWVTTEGNQKTVKISKGQFFVFQILNNTGYGADLNLKPAKFIPVNIIISPKSNK